MAILYNLRSKVGLTGLRERFGGTGPDMSGMDTRSASLLHRIANPAAPAAGATGLPA